MWSMFLWFAFGPVRTSLWESCCVGCWWWVLNADWSGRSFRRHRRGYWCGLQVRNRTWDMDTGMDTDCEMRGAIHERCTKKPTKTKKRTIVPFVILCCCFSHMRYSFLLFSCSPVISFSCFFCMRCLFLHARIIITFIISVDFTFTCSLTAEK